jgi:secretion/DNA translocation related TadE-like protein
MTAGRNQRGSVLILMCALIALAVVLMIAAVALGGAVVLASRAEAAADGAALAAADTLVVGPSGSACAAASVVAEADGAHLVECHLEPAAVEVVVELAGDRGEAVLALGRTVRARSRAEVDLSPTRGGAGG